jgi:FKBP-type peptidyl-prolyl cis-trans isomerase FklB
MGRLFLAAVATVVIPTMAWADGADTPPSDKPTSAVAAPGNPMPAIKADLNSVKQKGSFAIGYNMGSSLRKQIGGDGLDQAAFLLGIQQALSGQKATLSSIEQERSLKTLAVELQRKQMQRVTAEAESNRKKGEDFLAANAKKEGVKTLPSGLQYTVLKEGTGKHPKPTDTVQIHYHGTLVDGTVFDSTVERNEPITHRVAGFIEGWKEALPLMQEGAKWRIFVPSKLAYGPSGAGGKIGPNETLVFEIELLKVK